MSATSFISGGSLIKDIATGHLGLYLKSPAHAAQKLVVYLWVRHQRSAVEQIGLLVVLLVDFAGTYDWVRSNGAPILWDFLRY